MTACGLHKSCQLLFVARCVVAVASLQEGKLSFSAVRSLCLFAGRGMTACKTGCWVCVAMICGYLDKLAGWRDELSALCLTSNAARFRLHKDLDQSAYVGVVALHHECLQDCRVSLYQSAVWWQPVLVSG
jgi:hypothetical protein